MEFKEALCLEEMEKEEDTVEVTSILCVGTSDRLLVSVGEEVAEGQYEAELV